MSSKAKINQSLKGDGNQLSRVFDLFDDDKSGYISIANLRRFARDTGEGIDEDDLELMMRYADRDGDGYVSREEFYELFAGSPPLKW